MAYFQTVVFGFILFVLHNTNAISRVFSIDENGSPVVTTGVGSIRGVQAEDGDYSMFMGIPYADVDNNNPFGPSNAHPIFEDTFDAFDDSAICPQIEEFNQTIVGTLDCLHLNVYVPNSVNTGNTLPVLVWVYGGGLSIGFASRFLYGPSYIVRHDVILVTLNYRLGPYGFMCLDIPEVPGNQGLKDQRLALKWVKENIAAFGGDDSRITVFGNSAGGMSIDLHLYYSQEQLFHRMIPQSGVAMVNNIGASNPRSALQLAEAFNYTPTDVNDAILFLATVDAHEIIARSLQAGLGFGMCVEQEFNNVENFITTQPMNVENEIVRETDILIGYTNDELYASYSLMDEDVLANMNLVGNLLNQNFDFGEDYELSEELRRIVTNFYFGDDGITSQAAADIASDFIFSYPCMRAVKKYLDDGVENLYLFLFSYSGGRNFVKHRLNITGGGANHADEVGYLFDISYMEKPLDPEDELILDRMTELWTNFAKYGNPTPTTSEAVPLQWPRVTHDQWNYLDINTELRVSTRPMRSRMAFLDLFYKMNEEYRRRGFEPAPSSGSNIVLDISLPLLFAVKYIIYS